jgi:hypothetical protein
MSTDELYRSDDDDDDGGWSPSPTTPRGRRRAAVKYKAEYLAQTQGGSAEEYLAEADRLTPHEYAPQAYSDGDLTGAGYVLRATYNYNDEGGGSLYQVVRYEHCQVKGEKAFRQRRTWGGKWVADAGAVKVPYRWPELKQRPNDLVLWLEGEKDVDNAMALGLLATTCAGGKLSHTIVKALTGRDIAIIPDNDQSGRIRAEKALAAFRGRARSLRVVNLPGLLSAEDITDWLEGHSKEDLLKIIANTPQIGLRATPTPFIDGTKLPLRSWLYQPAYIREFVSETASPGGSGKSSLVIVEALAMVSGKSLLGVKPSGKLRVWYLNLEDPIDELHRRFAAAIKFHELTTEDIGEDWLFINSGLTMPIKIASDDGRSVRVDHSAVAEMIKIITDNRIDVVVLDPFASTHRVKENDNTAIDEVVKTFGSIAERTKCAIMIVHHTRKPNGRELTVDDSRGASALHDAVRSARVINTMGVEEAIGAGIDPGRRRRYFRVDDGKLSMLPPAEASDWYEIRSVDLGNALIDGDDVGVVAQWDYPTLDLRHLTPFQIMNVQSVIRAGNAAGTKYRKDARSEIEPWVGVPIAEALSLDLDYAPSKKAIKKLIETWIARKLLKVVGGKDRARHEREYVVVGDGPATVERTVRMGTDETWEIIEGNQPRAG